MNSWFDEAELQAAPADTSIGKEAQEGEPVRPAPSGSKRVGSSTWQVLGLLGALLVAVVGAAVVLMQSTGKDDASAATSSTTSVADPSKLVAVAGQCEPEAGEVRLSTGDKTLRGTIAAWETAYYDRDAAGLNDLLSTGSWMKTQNWSEILPEAAPEGSSWCAVMGPVKENAVDVDLMVTFSDGSSQTYQQKVSGAQSDSGAWLIDDIETR